MVKLFKPKFWEKREINFFAIFLFPLSLLTMLIIFLKRTFIKSLDFEIPVICVGNIYIGGTGKTPTSIFIAKELLKLGFKPAILRKYYISHADEYGLIKNEFNGLIVNKSRVDGILEAKEQGFKTIVLDDGFQDIKIRKTLSIICFNQNQKIGNGLVLPAGPLRENLIVLKSAHLIIINGKKDLDFEKKILKINKNLEIFYSHYKPINLNEFKNCNLLAIAGIANPDNFFNLLEENELIIKEKLVFPDHYKFNESEIKNIIKKAKDKNLKIIMTEKDFYKVKNYATDNINYLKVSMEIDDKQKLLKKLKEINV